MGKHVECWRLKEGDIVRTDRGEFILMWPAGRNRRGGTTFEGAYRMKVTEMLKNPKDTTKMQFYTVTPRRDTMEVVGKVSQTVVQKMRDMNALLRGVIDKTHRENMDNLNLKWNKNAVITKRSPFGGERVARVGSYEIMTQKGEHVKAGDLVMVQFSNGKFEMVLGNDTGKLYDGNTGRFLARSPWKVNAPVRTKLRYDPLRGIVQKTSRPKARSMPPESLLYLIKKKEDAENAARGY